MSTRCFIFFFSSHDCPAMYPATSSPAWHLRYIGNIGHPNRKTVKKTLFQTGQWCIAHPTPTQHLLVTCGGSSLLGSVTMSPHPSSLYALRALWCVCVPEGHKGPHLTRPWLTLSTRRVPGLSVITQTGQTLYYPYTCNLLHTKRGCAGVKQPMCYPRGPPPSGSR